MALRRFTAAILPGEDDWLIARCLEVAVTSQGKTVEEALANLQEALELYFEDEPIGDVPKSGPIIAPLDVEVRA